MELRGIDIPIVPSLIGAIALYILSQLVYNITLHPLANFPGPKLAAATRWYEYYYEIWLGGRFGDHIFELHQRYGPIVRINPSEVHILDRTFYDTLYNFDAELDKKVNAISDLQSTPSFEVHRMRRKAFDPFFSKAGILKIEPLIRDLVEKMCTRLQEAKETGAVAKISLIYRCLTTDIISEYSFSSSRDLLDDPSGNEESVNALVGVFKIVFLLRECGSWMNWIIESLGKLPEWAMPSTDYLGLRVKEIKERIEIVKRGEHKDRYGHAHSTVFEQYAQDPRLPAEEKTDKMLYNNALMLLAAGFETTGYALSAATCYILADVDSCSKVKAELAKVWPRDGSMPAWTDLEKLPYLSACLKESLRLSIGVMSRLSRVNHHQSIQYKQWTIPPGVAVGMSQRFILYDEEIFRSPTEFRPERWLEGEKSKDLLKWLVSFSRGARGCIGQNLAWAELYVALAAVMHRFDLELNETDRRDVDPKYDYFVPFPETDRGVRVRVK